MGSMARATDRFLQEIRRSHEVYAYVEMKAPNQEVKRLPAIDGSVKVDRTAAVRRSLSVECVDPLGTLVPSGTNSPLTPYGTELYPYRGVRYADGTTEVYPLGVFRLAKVSVSDTSDGSPKIGLEAFDRSRTVARDKFTATYTIPTGTNIIDAIKGILERTFPDLEYDAISTSVTTTAPQFYDAGDDPWAVCTRLAQSLGCELYFNVEGGVVIAPPVDIDALPAPDFTYIEGQGCIMMDLAQVYTDEPGFNGVIVTGESPGDELPPVRAAAWDDEPSSATYRLGPYGEVPKFITDQNVKTQADADAMAQSLLRNLIGFSSNLDITALVNPTFECGDVIQVSRARSHVDGLYALDAFDVPMKASATQSLGVRQKRTV